MSMEAGVSARKIAEVIRAAQIQAKQAIWWSVMRSDLLAAHPAIRLHARWGHAAARGERRMPDRARADAPRTYREYEKFASVRIVGSIRLSQWPSANRALGPRSTIF